MPIQQAKFCEIEAQRRAAFHPPYYGSAEFGDHGMRLSFAVLKGKEKVFEANDQIAAQFADPRVVERLVRTVKNDLARRFPDSLP